MYVHTYIQLKPCSRWLPGIVEKKIGWRRYKVKLNNGLVFIRNRKFIKKV